MGGRCEHRVVGFCNDFGAENGHFDQLVALEESQSDEASSGNPEWSVGLKNQWESSSGKLCKSDHIRPCNCCGDVLTSWWR